MVPPSALGTIRRPASEGPSRRTSSACGPGCSCNRVCSKTPPISISLPTCTSTARSGMPSSSLPPRARLIHSSASRVGLRPLTDSPLGGGSRLAWSLPRVTCTPVRLLWLRAARARRWPRPHRCDQRPSAAARPPWSPAARWPACPAVPASPGGFPPDPNSGAVRWAVRALPVRLGQVDRDGPGRVTRDIGLEPRHSGARSISTPASRLAVSCDSNASLLSCT